MEVFVTKNPEMVGERTEAFHANSEVRRQGIPSSLSDLGHTSFCETD